jgi:hypothetical protein
MRGIGEERRCRCGGIQAGQAAHVWDWRLFHGCQGWTVSEAVWSHLQPDKRQSREVILQLVGLAARCCLAYPGGDVARLGVKCGVNSTIRVPQKDEVDGGSGVAAQSISPRPLARAREIVL